MMQYFELPGKMFMYYFYPGQNFGQHTWESMILHSDPATVSDWSVTLQHDLKVRVLASLHWLPVSIRIVFKILLFTFMALKDLDQKHISDLLTENTACPPDHSDLLTEPCWLTPGCTLGQKVLLFEHLNSVTRCPQNSGALNLYH